MIFSIVMPFASQARINIARTAALRGVAGNVYKFTFLFAAGACIGRTARSDPESAPAAFPESHPAARAYVPYKTAVSRVTALSAYHFIRHDLFLPW
jgi:hypothetical protein